MQTFSLSFPREVTEGNTSSPWKGAAAEEKERLSHNKRKMLHRINASCLSGDPIFFNSVNKSPDRLVVY